jgi:hypothetical protein
MSVVKLSLLLMLFQGSIAYGATAEEVYISRFRPRIEAVKTKLESQNTLHDRTGPTPACKKRYEKLYSNGDLKIALALGYYDNRPGGNAVQDIVMDAEISRMLTSKCTPNQTVCGFSEVKPNPTDKYSKFFGKRVSGPDGSARIIKIKLFHAAENINDDVNRTSEAQVLRSNAVENAFRYSLRTADVVFYLGHSRDGGGPDFDPPRILPDLHVDYNWYHQNKGDFRELLTEIGARAQPPKLLAMLSCSSAMHFASGIRRVSPHAGLLLSLNTIGDGQMFEGLGTFLNGIQKFRCEAQLSADLNAVNIDKTKVGAQERSLLQFRGFPPQ